jgi:hypothetical protein
MMQPALTDHSIRGLSKKYPTIFSPTVSNGEMMGKLSVVVEGTFMRVIFCCLATPPDAFVTARERSGVTRVHRILVSLKMTEHLEQRYCSAPTQILSS